MNENAIRKLKQKFILVAMSSLVLTMTIISGFLYLGNLAMNRQIVHNTLNYIIENNGKLETWDESNDRVEMQEAGYVRFLEDIFSTNRDYRSPEFKFSTRYFAILFDSQQNITQVKTNYISAISDTEAEEYGKRALEHERSFGRFDDYYYQVAYEEDGSGIIVYLDSTSILQSNSRLLYLALALIAFGFIIAFCVVRMFAGRAISSEVRNAEIQQQFMTDISHELKTPLAVIRANTEMEEILSGENEWTASTLRQVERMNGLIQNLVMIARADEENAKEESADVNITQAVHETVQNFQALAMRSGKHMEENLEPDLHMQAQSSQIRQLCSLLVDNAIKYCDDSGRIRVELQRAKSKGITLVVANSFADSDSVDTSRFFHRFYRQDASHNIDRGGYGIGLSIAESIVRQYAGSISVEGKQGIITFTCQLKPMK